MTQGLLVDASGPPVQPCYEALDLFRRGLAEATAACDFGKPPPGQGEIQLREDLALRFGGEPDHFIVTGGVRSAIPVLRPLLSDVAVEAPTFTPVPSTLQALNASVRRSDWDEMGSTSAWVTSPGRNPDGRSISTEQGRHLERECPVLVVNEVYRLHTPAPPERWQPTDDVFAVGSFSKLAGPGSRLGWIRSSRIRELWPGLERAVVPPAVWQSAWSWFLRRDGLELLTTAAKTSIQMADLFAEKVGRHNVVWGGDGPHMLVPLPTGWESAAAVAMLAEQGITVNDGTYFDATNPAIRLSFAGLSSAAVETAAACCRSVLYENSNAHTN